eukprot:jgi/Mesvir1/7136/Mv21514-RA.1
MVHSGRILRAAPGRRQGKVLGVNSLLFPGPGDQERSRWCDEQCRELGKACSDCSDIHQSGKEQKLLECAHICAMHGTCPKPAPVYPDSAVHCPAYDPRLREDRVAARLAHTLDMLEACVTSVRAGPLQALTRAQVWSGTGVASQGGHTDGLAAVESRMDPSEPSEQVLLNASATLRNLFRLYATRTSGRKHPAQPHAAANSHSSGGTMASSGGSSQPSGKPGGGTSRLGGQRWANSTHAGAPTTDAHGHGTPGHAPLMSSSSSPTSSAAGGDYELLLSSSRFSRMVREYDLLGRGFTTSWPVFLQRLSASNSWT